MIRRIKFYEISAVEFIRKFKAPAARMRVKKLYQNEIFVISIICLFQGIFLLYAISNLSISYYEAEIFYDKKSLVSLIANLSCEIFGRNDYTLRVPFILIHFANAAMIKFQNLF